MTFFDSAVVVNEDGVDVDFRVESDTNTHALFVEGSSSNVGIGVSTPLVPLHINSTAAGEMLRIESTEGGAAYGPILGLFRNSGSPADGDGLGAINFYGEDSASNITTYGQIRVESTDVSNGTEDGLMSIRTIINGTDTARLNFKSDEAVFNESGIDLDFRVESSGNTHALFVEGSSGNVAIGTTTVNSKFNVASSQDTLKYNEGVTVFRSTSSNKMFLNCVAGGANIVGSNSPITFNYHDQTTNNVTEAVRIVSGNLLVGKTASDLGVTAGIELNGQYDVGYFTRSGDKPLVVNRLSSDGTILDIRKDGTSVGSIGVVNANNLTIGGAVASHAGMEFGTNQIAPRSGGTSVDATVDLGYFSLRWKDLYLSGGVYLGGTGAANKLEDYESGTWTPTAQLYSGTMTVNSATYTKIGNLVTLRASVSFDATADGSNVSIQSLPFAHTGEGKGNGGFVTSSTVSSAVRLRAVGTGSIYLLGADNSNVTYTTMSSTTLEFIMIYEAA